MKTLALLAAQPWVDRLGWTLIHFLWQGAAIAAVFAIARRFTRVPGTRHTLACIALAAMAATPLVTFAILGSASAGPSAPVGAIPDSVAAVEFQRYLPVSA